MSVNLFDGFHNKIAGESFRCLVFDKKAFVFEWNVQPQGYVPFEHIHLNQDEIFYIKRGEISLTIDGKEHIGRAGETITIPKGRRHIARNNKPELLSCIVEYRPGLDTYTFFQCFAGLTIDQDTDKRGKINIAKMLYFTKRMGAKCITRPTSIPAPMFYLALEVCYFAGRILGWNKLFEKYTKSEKVSGPARRKKSSAL